MGNIIYPYEYLMTGKNSMKHHYQRELLCHLNIDDNTDADCPLTKRVCKDFEVKNLVELHVQSDTVLLTDLFNNFPNMSWNSGLDPAHFLSAPRLACQAVFKKTKVKWGLLTNINILLTVEKSIRGAICHAIHRYTSANNTWKIMIKI